MKAGAPRFEAYEGPKGREWMLVRAADAPAQTLLIPPLFEEANFLRGFLTDFAGSLAELGIGSWIPDLPGTGESLVPLEAVSWEDWREAVRAARERVRTLTGAAAHLLAFRGGALLLDPAPQTPLWLFSPADGASLLRVMERSTLISTSKKIRYSSETIAGYRLSSGLRDGLAIAAPPVGEAVQSFDAPATLLRRIEPGRDGPLARAAAEDAARWIARCAGR